jgi:hypothetical protein
VLPWTKRHCELVAGTFFSGRSKKKAVAQASTAMWLTKLPATARCPSTVAHNLMQTTITIAGHATSGEARKHPRDTSPSPVRGAAVQDGDVELVVIPVATSHHQKSKIYSFHPFAVDVHCDSRRSLLLSNLFNPCRFALARCPSVGCAVFCILSLAPSPVSSIACV